MRLKNYSSNTVTVYRSWVNVFLKYFPSHKPSSITKNEIIDFLIEHINNSQLSATAENQLISSLKLFYEHVWLREKETYDLPRALKPQQLPTVFAEEEILKIIKVTENLKHKTILCLVYAQE